MSTLRTWRFWILLNENGLHPPRFALFCIVIVRNLCSDLLPARIGTLAYVYLVCTRLAVPVSAALSSFAVAFLLDVASLFPVVLPLLLLVTLPDVLEPWVIAAASSVIFLAALSVIYFLPRLLRFTHRITSNLNGSMFAAISETTRSVEKDLSCYSRPSLYLKLMIITVLSRIAKYTGFYILFCALLLPLGYSLEELPFAPVIIGITASEVAASLPISGVGGFGAYEGVWALMFGLLGFSQDVAALTALSHHLFTQVYGYLLGLLALGILVTPLVQVKRPSVPILPRSFHARTALSALAMFFFLTPLLNAKPQNRENQRFQLKKQQVRPNTNRNGKVIFDSNVSGTFGIYSLTLPSGELAVITNSDSHEMYPSIDPQRERIAFAKTLSTLRSAHSDIWIYSFANETSSQVAANGTFPSFSSDGKSIFFERQRRQVVELDLVSNSEREILPGSFTVWNGYKIVKPKVSPDGRKVAFISDRPSKWHTWIVDTTTGNEVNIGESCEPAWIDNNSLAFINKTDAKAGSGVWKYNLGTKASEVLIDADDPFGHEYFPEPVSENGLLFGASPSNQHSHTKANYEIFLFENGKRTQLTQLGATSRWPKFVTSSPAK